jgi:hypothetical protein
MIPSIPDPGAAARNQSNQYRLPLIIQVRVEPGRAQAEIAQSLPEQPGSSHLPAAVLLAGLGVVRLS